MKNKIYVTAFDEDKNYDLPTKPDELIAFFQEKIALVPEEYKDTAEIEIEAESIFDNYTALNIKITYRRPESDEEEKKRLEREKAQKEWRENQELCQLEKLKEKYGV